MKAPSITLQRDILLAACQDAWQIAYEHHQCGPKLEVSCPWCAVQRIVGEAIMRADGTVDVSGTGLPGPHPR
jgi:hypothetical protein